MRLRRALHAFGSHGDSGERKLVPEKKCFLRGAVDEFLLECQYIGELERLRIRHKNNGQHSSWFIEKVCYLPND